MVRLRLRRFPHQPPPPPPDFLPLEPEFFFPSKTTLSLILSFPFFEFVLMESRTGFPDELLSRTVNVRSPIRLVNPLTWNKREVINLSLLIAV